MLYLMSMHFLLRKRRILGRIAMFIGSCMFYLSIDWANSLKDKRQCIKSITDKMKHKFNISVAEVSENDNHNIGVIGFVCVSNSKIHVEQTIDTVLKFVQNHTEAEVYNIEIEIF